MATEKEIRMLKRANTNIVNQFFRNLKASVVALEIDKKTIKIVCEDSLEQVNEFNYEEKIPEIKKLINNILVRLIDDYLVNSVGLSGFEATDEIKKHESDIRAIAIELEPRVEAYIEELFERRAAA